MADKLLEIACKKRNFNKIKKLLPQTTFNGRYKCLETLCKNGDYSLFHNLLNLCTNELSVFDLNWLIYSAIKGGNINIVNAIIDAGADDFESGLITSTFKGKSNLIFRFIELGARNFDDGLEVASSSGNLHLVRKFIELGARDYNTALKVAILRKHINVANFLIGLGQSIHPELIHRYNQLLNKQHAENTNTMLTLSNTGSIRRRGLLGSFRPKKERPSVPPEIVKKIISYLEFGNIQKKFYTNLNGRRN